MPVHGFSRRQALADPPARIGASPVAQEEWHNHVPALVPTRETVALRVWREVLVPYLGTRLVVFVVSLVATYYIWPLLATHAQMPAFASQGAFPQALWLIWRRFDSGFYVGIAQYGYLHATASMLHTQTDWVFYPLYPLLIAGLGHLLGGGSTSFDLAGLLIANVAGAGMVIYLYLLVEQEFGRDVASRTVLYLALFPLAFFLSAIYTESLLLGLSVACIYYARRRSWWLAGLCGGLAALTRLQGVALLVPLTWEYLRVQSSCEVTPPNVWPERLMARVLLQSRYFVRGLRLAARRPRTWLNALALGLVPCGLLAFMCYGQWYIGDFFATFHASKWGWGRQLSSPLRLLVYSVRHPIWGQPLNWNFWTLNMVATCAFLAVLVWAFRRLPLIYALYTAVTVLLPLSSDSLNSIARYDLLVFPAFILLALYTCWQEKRASMRQQTLHHFIIGAFASLQAVLLVLFVLGAFAIA